MKDTLIYGIDFGGDGSAAVSVNGRLVKPETPKCKHRATIPITRNGEPVYWRCECGHVHTKEKDE